MEEKICEIKIEPIYEIKNTDAIKVEERASIPTVYKLGYAAGQACGAVFNDDCLRLMPKIPDRIIDFILCDLPYGRTQNKEDAQIPFDSLWKEYRRIIKPNGCIALFADGMFMADLMKSNEKWWRYNLVWDKVLKSGFLNSHRMPLRQHEEICIFYKKPPTYNPQFTEGSPLHGQGERSKKKGFVKNNRNYGEFRAIGDERKGSTEKYPTSIITIPKPHPSKALHRTEKPVELCEWLIKTYTNEGDTVLDNCMGSGSTCVAALKNKRIFFGIEKSEEYYRVARDRIDKEQQALWTV